MEKERLAQWLKHQAHRIRKHAGDVKPSFFPETIHQFRTDTKKLRAVLQLISLATDERYRLSKPFRKLYRAAGAIRDRQVQLRYLAGDKRHTLPDLSIWLAHEAGNATADWNHRYEKADLRELGDWIASLHVPHIGISAIKEFFNRQLDEIRTLAGAGPDDAALHALRKKAKSMQHILQVCKDEWPEVWGRFQPQVAALERLGDRAGAYNDRSNLLSVLAQFRHAYRDQLNDAQEAAVAKASGDWTRAQARERKAVLTATRGLLRLKMQSRPAIAGKD